MKMASEMHLDAKCDDFSSMGRRQHNIQTYPWQIQPKVEKAGAALRLTDLFG